MTDIHLRGTLQENALLDKFTSWRVGGPAERLYVPADLSDLSEFLKTCSEAESLIFLGLGSNTLVRDGGVKGTVILTLQSLNDYPRDRRTFNNKWDIPKFCNYTELTGRQCWRGTQCRFAINDNDFKFDDLE